MSYSSVIPDAFDNVNEENIASEDTRLGSIRNAIDEIDSDILKLLNKRAALSLEVGKIKKHKADRIYKPLREKELLNKLYAENSGPLPDAHLASIWREILSSSRELQRPQKIAYLGPEGTFSHFAGMDYLGHSASFKPCRDILQVFEEVSSGGCHLGVVPLENSLQGSVGVSLDLFLKHEVIINAELYSRITHSLLSNCANFSDIRRVYSHPQPLAQCQGWLRANLPNVELLPVESTAAAAKAAFADTNGAAIGHARLAKMNDLEILANKIEDEPGNWTRFVIISSPKFGTDKKRLPESSNGADKTSLLFTVPDKPGALSQIIELFASHKVNMRKLESRPMRGHPWKYVFFADVESALNEVDNGLLLQKLDQTCNSFRILGCYAAGSQIDNAVKEEAEKANKEVVADE